MLHVISVPLSNMTSAAPLSKWKRLKSKSRVLTSKFSKQLDCRIPTTIVFRIDQPKSTSKNFGMIFQFAQMSKLSLCQYLLSS